MAVGLWPARRGGGCHRQSDTFSCWGREIGGQHTHFEHEGWRLHLCRSTRDGLRDCWPCSEMKPHALKRTLRDCPLPFLCASASRRGDIMVKSRWGEPHPTGNPGTAGNPGTVHLFPNWKVQRTGGQMGTVGLSVGGLTSGGGRMIIRAYGLPIGGSGPSESGPFGQHLFC